MRRGHLARTAIALNPPKRPGPRPLPDWPAVLHEEWAAAYLSLSATTFREQVAPAVPPIQLTIKRIGWRRTDLDAWIARQGGAGGGVAEIEVNSWDVSIQRKRRPR